MPKGVGYKSGLSPEGKKLKKTAGKFLKALGKGAKRQARSMGKTSKGLVKLGATFRNTVGRNPVQRSISRDISSYKKGVKKRLGTIRKEKESKKAAKKAKRDAAALKERKRQQKVLKEGGRLNLLFNVPKK